MRIVQAGLRAFALPLVRPLATAHGPIHLRTGFLVTLEDEEGRLGSGEATPLSDFGGEDLAACHAALRRALAALVKTPLGLEDPAPLAVRPIALPSAHPTADRAARTAAHPTAWREAIAACCVRAPVARAALEAAVADLAAQRAGLPLAHWIRREAGLPGEPAASVAVQALVAGARPEEVAASARQACERGFTTFKLKLAVTRDPRDAVRPGCDAAWDRERVAALREAIGPGGRIRLDANEAWSRSGAERALALLAPFGIEFVEQPVGRHDLEGLAALDRDGPIAIAADESLIEPGVEACLARRPARIFVVKQAVLGGIGPALALAARARAAGIRLVHSNLIEARVGRATALALAAALAAPAGRAGASAAEDAPDAAAQDEVHGLATADWLARDLGDAEAHELAAGHRSVAAGPRDVARLVPYAGPGLGASPGPAWSLAGEPWGEGERVEADWLAWTADRHAARKALVFAGCHASYGALAAAARAAGDALARLGIGAGDLVAVLAPPSPCGVTLVHALLERRAVLLPINARLAEPELVQVLETTRPAALVVDAAVDAALARRLAEASGCALYTLAAASADAPLACAFEPARAERGAMGGASRRAPRDRAALCGAGAALVLMTSGTSGRAKAAVLTRANLIASAQASARLLGSAADDRWLLCLPLFHIGGLSILVRAALAGACVVLESRFNAARVADALDRERITHVSFVATTLAQLLDARTGRGRPPTLRVALIGGGPAPDALLARALAAGIPIAPTYGLTEAASQVATRPPEQGSAATLDSDLAGGLVALPGVSLRIVDGMGAVVAAGEEGEIEVRGPTVMHGYLDEPEATARVLRGGWLATGDVGRLDERGRLRVLDRRGDLIVSGGENVYPAELESIIAAHPDVLEAGVVGVPDARFGARPLAFVVWRAGAAGDPASLAAWCRARLAGYKQPVAFVATDTLPRNAAGKLLRRALAERALEYGA